MVRQKYQFTFTLQKFFFHLILAVLKFLYYFYTLEYNIKTVNKL